MKLEDFNPNAGLKKCQYCAEMIQAEAIVCKHCGRNISPQPIPTLTPVVNNAVDSQALCPYCKSPVHPKARVCPNCRREISTAGIIGSMGNSFFIIGILIICIGCILIMLLGSY